MDPILVVEDDPPSRELVRFLLHANGHAVVTAANGREALDLIDANPVRFVLCDLSMAEMNGYEFIEAVRDRGGRSLVVIAVTALSMKGDRNKALSAGFDGYITKPIDPQTFVNEVFAVVEGGSG
jgi:CheY-like chemotaxis protein